MKFRRGAARFAILIALSGFIGASSVPLVMRGWHVDLDQASTAVAVSMSCAVVILRSFIVLVLELPEPDQRPIFVSRRIKILTGFTMVALAGTLATITLLLTYVAFLALGMNWAMQSAMTAFRVSAGVTVVSLLAVPLTITGWALSHHVRKISTVFSEACKEIQHTSDIAIMAFVMNVRRITLTHSRTTRLRHRSA